MLSFAAEVGHSACKQAGGFVVNVTVGRLEVYSVYSHHKNDKDQLKGTTTTNKHRNIEYIQLQVQILQTTQTTSDARQHSINN